MTETPKRAHLDYEAFSPIPHKDWGAHQYATWKGTAPLSAQWALEDEEPELWLPGKPVPTPLFDYVEKEGANLYAWNAEFEIEMTEHVFSRHGWPIFHPDRWRCTQSIALLYGSPMALGNAGRFFGVEEETAKDARGKHLINKLCKPRTPSAKDPSTRWTLDNAFDDFLDFYEYGLQDVRAERAVLLALPRLELTDEELLDWRLTCKMNRRGWASDLKSCRRILKLLNAYRGHALEELADITSGDVTSVNQIEKIIDWINEQGIIFFNLQKETVADALRTELPPQVRRVLQIRQELGKASFSKFDAQLRLADEDGRIRNGVTGNGAYTGRDKAHGEQYQNYTRDTISKTQEGIQLAMDVLHQEDPIDEIGTLYGSVPGFAAMLPRHTKTASPGNILYVGDYSSIENRLGAWYSGSEYALDIFRKGEDEYRHFSARYNHVNYEDVTDAQRNHGKQAVLMLIYGGGPPRFRATCAQHNIECDVKESKQTVRFYREDLYPEVVKTWYALDETAKDCIESSGARRVLELPYTSVEFRIRKGYLQMRLASGRRISYKKPRVEDVRTPWGAIKESITFLVDTKAGAQRNSIIPSIIFQNLIQGSALDVMKAGIRSVESIGYPVVGRIHDEAAAERKIGEGDLDEYLNGLCPRLPWLNPKDVPILATGYTGLYWTKD